MQNKYSNPLSSTPHAFDYHQQKRQLSSNDYFADQDPLISSPDSRPMRLHTVNNKFYGHPNVDPKYERFNLPKKTNFQSDEGDDSPVYSTTTDALSENGSSIFTSSFLNRQTPPAPKPRYSTLGSHRSPTDTLDKVPYAKPRSRSNSRTRLNHPNSDNVAYFFEEQRPASSSDSGICQSDALGLSNGDTLRLGSAQTELIHLQQQQAQTVPTLPSHSVKSSQPKSSILTGTPC